MMIAIVIITIIMLVVVAVLVCVGLVVSLLRVVAVVLDIITIAALGEAIKRSCRRVMSVRWIIVVHVIR